MICFSYSSKDKLIGLRGAFAPVPFVNPLFGANGEPIDEEDYENHPGYVPYENSEETYRSYSNPSFESGPMVDVSTFHCSSNVSVIFPVTADVLK